MLVTDLPLWPDHPWPMLVPTAYEVRRAGDVVAFVNRTLPNGEVKSHVDFLLSETTLEHVRGALYQLGVRWPTDAAS